KTLEGMDEIESARVHVTPKKESIFAEKEEGAKASVMVRVRQNKELSNERTEGIVALVASSIEGLDPSNISVMDTHGRLLVAAGHDRSGANGNSGAFQAQLEAKQKFEAETAARVMTLLEPVVGDNRVRTDVAADIDFSQTEQNEEKYNPQSQVVRSQQTSQEARNAAGLVTPGGVVGARANNPATQPSPTPPPATPAASGDSRTTSTVNYEIDKTTKKTIGGGGRINRLTVSVVVDHKLVGGIEVARTTDEIRQIQDLVGAAVGIDPNRGDSVVVQTMPFSKPEAENTGAAASFLEKNKQIVSNSAKYGALVLVALLILFFVVRPARNALKAASAQADAQRLLLPEGVQERRKAEMDSPKQIGDSTYSELRPMMTVAEMEEQMETGGLEGQRVEKLRKQIAAQSIDDTETVVGTMRGWLREGA
ncbi:MAG: flagellar basal-body MS-ring/collar protein FliF, partial [Acidobacteriota bacterium]